MCIVALSTSWDTAHTRYSLEESLICTRLTSQYKSANRTQQVRGGNAMIYQISLLYKVHLRCLIFCRRRPSWPLTHSILVMIDQKLNNSQSSRKGLRVLWTYNCELLLSQFPKRNSDSAGPRDFRHPNFPWKVTVSINFKSLSNSSLVHSSCL